MLSFVTNILYGLLLRLCYEVCRSNHTLIPSTTSWLCSLYILLHAYMIMHDICTNAGTPLVHTIHFGLNVIQKNDACGEDHPQKPNLNLNFDTGFVVVVMTVTLAHCPSLWLIIIAQATGFVGCIMELRISINQLFDNQVRQHYSSIDQRVYNHYPTMSQPLTKHEPTTNQQVTANWPSTHYPSTYLKEIPQAASHSGRRRWGLCHRQSHGRRQTGAVPGQRMALMGKCALASLL